MYITLKIAALSAKKRKMVADLHKLINRYVHKYDCTQSALGHGYFWEEVTSRVRLLQQETNKGLAAETEFCSSYSDQSPNSAV